MDEVVTMFRGLYPELNLSVRYLISFILDMSDIELRTRLLHYQSQIYAVPLIYPSQISYMNHERDMTYVPEIYFNMKEGFGVFNFGIG